MRKVAIAADARVRYPAMDGASSDSVAPKRSEDKGLKNGGVQGAIFDMVRSVLSDLGLDRARYGTDQWNPLGDLVRPGARILIKPNWVLHHNAESGDLSCLVTHPSILRAVLDFVMLCNPSEVVIGDAPLQDCDFEVLMALGFRSIVNEFRSRGLNVHISDFRRTSLRQMGHALFVTEGLRSLDRYVLVDLGSQSLLEPISQLSEKFRVTRYDPYKMRENHASGKHRYLVAKEVLEADLVINLPKLKTHMKAGITGALKNLVGIIGSKEYLPHHRKGPVSLGGDNYKDFSIFKAIAEALLDFANRRLDRHAVVRECNRLVYALLVLDRKLGGDGNIEGGWYGNDTVWRTCLDLNRVLLYAEASEQQMQSEPLRVELSITDAIVAGEGEGPLKPTPRPMGVILGALNAAASDYVAALLMGFDPNKIPLIKNAFALRQWPIATFQPADIECILNGQPTEIPELVETVGVRAKPPGGWKGHCELVDIDKALPMRIEEA